MMLIRHFALLLLTAVIVAGCGSSPPAPEETARIDRQVEGVSGSGGGEAAGADYYTVQQGDTAYSIALNHGMSVDDLVALNRLSDPAQLKVGQRLRISDATATQQPASGAMPATDAQPVVLTQPISVRPLDPGDASAAPPDAAADGALVLVPRGGKLAYSPENLALLQQQAKGGQIATAPPPPAPPPAAKPEPAPAPATKPTASSAGWSWPADGKLLAKFNSGGGNETNNGIDIATSPGAPVLAASDGKVLHVGSEGQIRNLGKFIVVKHNKDYLSVYGNIGRVFVKQNDQVSRGSKIADAGSAESGQDAAKLHFEVRRRGKPVDPMQYLPPR